MSAPGVEEPAGRSRVQELERGIQYIEAIEKSSRALAHNGVPAPLQEEHPVDQAKDYAMIGTPPLVRRAHAKRRGSTSCPPDIVARCV
jgi:hypothetical protein